jgi:DNA invertase Pin-like site-specific DNA recombinase
MQDNMDDMVRRGRAGWNPKKGESHYKTKLKDVDIRRIRDLSRSGISGIDVSKMFSISSARVSEICSRKAWAHVE